MVSTKTILHNQANNRSDNGDEDLEIAILVNAKKAGLSLEELNEFRVCDFVKYMEIYTGGKTEDGPRVATQKDIDNFLR